MFSGIGGFELGIKQAIPDAKCIGFSEIDKWAISIYRRHFKGHKNYGDANKINPSEIPDFDILVGGFPCQAFSIAGNRQGFDDTRGTLFFEITRILESKRPGLFVLENVKGLLSHNEGATFKTIISSLDELGYDTQWQVLNSKDFGVPQNRERVFIVGHLRASFQRARQIFPIRLGHSKTTGISAHENISTTLIARPQDGTRSGTYVVETQFPKIDCIGNINPSGNGANGNVFSADGLCPTLTTNKGEGLKLVCFNAEHGLRDKDPNPKRGGGSGILSRDDGLSYALTKTHANHPVQLIGGMQSYRVYDSLGIAVIQSALGGGIGAKTGLYAVPVLSPDRVNKRQNGRRFKTSGEPSHTLTAQDRHGVLVGTVMGSRIRRLTPIESERLQGFPDNWTQCGVDGEEISDTQRYKCCGNAVTVNAVVAIFNELAINP